MECFLILIFVADDFINISESSKQVSIKHSNHNLHHIELHWITTNHIESHWFTMINIESNWIKRVVIDYLGFRADFGKNFVANKNLSFSFIKKFIIKLLKVLGAREGDFIQDFFYLCGQLSYPADRSGFSIHLISFNEAIDRLLLCLK